MVIFSPPNCWGVVRNCRADEISQIKCTAILFIGNSKLIVTPATTSFCYQTGQGHTVLHVNWFKKIIQGGQQIYSNQISLITELFSEMKRCSRR